MLPRVIGLNGFAGSGKDTVAQYFIQNHGYRKISMADAVKDVLSIVFGWDRYMLAGETPESREWREIPDVYWTEKLGYDFTPRIAMQQIGTDLFRKHFDQEIWCNVVRKKIHDTFDKVIIPDCRFLNEMKIVWDFGGDIIEVQRGDEPEWYGMASAENLGTWACSHGMKEEYPNIHPSEYKWIGVNNPKYIVKNDNSLEDLYNVLSGLYQ